MDHNLQEQLNS